MPAQDQTKALQWLVIGIAAVAGFMTAPESQATRLAVIGKVAEIASDQMGGGAMGQASIASAMSICLAFSPLTDQMPSGGGSMDRLCGLVSKMQQSTRVFNFGVAKLGILAVKDAPLVGCVGALYTVKCLGFGSVTDKI